MAFSSVVGGIGSGLDHMVRSCTKWYSDVSGTRSSRADGILGGFLPLRNMSCESEIFKSPSLILYVALGTKIWRDRVLFFIFLFL